MSMRFSLKKYGNPVFVETGTFRGAGVKAALRAGFQTIYSIELVPELYAECSAKFEKEIAGGRVKLILGDSVRELEGILEGITRRTTFWLDAHSMEHNRGRIEGELPCPLYVELETIARHAIKDHTLLIDDVRLIENPSAWGGHDVTKRGLVDRIMAINPAYTIALERGYRNGDVLAAFTHRNNSPAVVLDKCIIESKSFIRRVAAKLRSSEYKLA